MRSILMACNSNKLKFQGKCFAHLIRKNGYFGISSLRTCQHFLPWPSHTLHVQHNEGQTFIKSYLNIMLCNSTNIANLQNFIFLHRIIKKVTNSLSDPPRTAPVAFLGSSNFFIQRILNFTAHFLNTYCLLIGQKVNKLQKMAV